MSEPLRFRRKHASRIATAIIPPRPVLLDKMAQTVTVTGTLVKKGGTQVLYMTSVE